MEQHGSHSIDITIIRQIQIEIKQILQLTEVSIGTSVNTFLMIEMPS